MLDNIDLLGLYWIWVWSQPKNLAAHTNTWDRGVILMAYASMEEGFGSLFQPDTLVSSQYFDVFRSKANLEPEKSLILAILEDAVYCFKRYALSQERKGKSLYCEAEQWIMEENSHWIFSFENICEFLDIDPHYLRRGLRTWKESHLRRAGRGCFLEHNRPEVVKGSRPVRKPSMSKRIELPCH